MVQRTTNAATVNFSSSNPATIAVVQADAVSTVSRLLFGTVTLPNNATAYLLQVLNGSTVQVDAGPSTLSVGTATQGCLVDGVSKLLWNGSGFAGAAGSTGIAFDIRNQSNLSLPVITTPRTFSNFATMFRFDNNSSGFLSSLTSTTSAGGTNVSALNGSLVELDNAVTFSASGANVGVNTAPGGRVEKQVGATFTNNAATPVSAASCSVTSAQAISTYPCTLATGIAIVTP
jgi:hypothetical protein